MNSSSDPILAVQPRSASRASCAFRIERGACATGVPSCHSMSACTITVPSSHVQRRSVARSGRNTKSP